MSGGWRSKGNWDPTFSTCNSLNSRKIAYCPDARACSGRLPAKRSFGATAILATCAALDHERERVKLLPFVPCLLLGILLSNIALALFPRVHWPAHGLARADFDYALSILLAMSLMSMQLWTLAGVAGPLLDRGGADDCGDRPNPARGLLALGRDYQWAVPVGGLHGMSLGSTRKSKAAFVGKSFSHE